MTDIPRISTTFLDVESGSSSPVLTGLDSSSALILVHDDDEEDSPIFEENLEDGDQDEYNSIFRPYIQPLTPLTTFLYLFSPYLKLGAILLPNADMPLKFSLPALLLFAVLAAFARQIWYMLSRYLRKGDLEDVLLDAFTHSKGSRRAKERFREIVRTGTRVSTGTSRLFLATIYLRGMPQLSLLLLNLIPVACRGYPCTGSLASVRRLYLKLGIHACTGGIALSIRHCSITRQQASNLYLLGFHSHLSLVVHMCRLLACSWIPYGRPRLATNGFPLARH